LIVDSASTFEGWDCFPASAFEGWDCFFAFRKVPIGTATVGVQVKSPAELACENEPFLLQAPIEGPLVMAQSGLRSRAAGCIGRQPVHDHRDR
jgi:hypothetical protein